MKLNVILLITTVAVCHT